VPIYEYRCPNGHTFELFQKMTDSSPSGCPVCAAGPVEKILFPVAVHFKGSGFYSTDYGRKARSSSQEGEGAPKSEKPAEKAADKPDKPTSTDTKTSSSDSS
jgi:putative FmdB family regulatory protein